MRQRCRRVAGGWCPAASSSRLRALLLLSCAAIARAAAACALSSLGLAPPPRFATLHLLVTVRATRRFVASQSLARLEWPPSRRAPRYTTRHARARRPVSSRPL